MDDSALPMRKLRYTKRPGFDNRGMRWLYRLLYPFFHCRVRIPGELRESGDPVVFIANHYNIFGPISFVVSVPVASHIWINTEMIQRDKTVKTLRPGVHQVFPFLGDRALDWLCGKLAGLASGVLSRVGAIPVDRNKPSSLISTMRESIRTLEEGRNLLIFPETGFPEYSLTSVTPFFSGFATLGRLYYRKTGKNLRFCPCYIDEQHHLIRMGETEIYNPDAPDAAAETERVSDTLNRRIREMAAENRGVEKQKSIPVRRTILFFCNLLRALLLIPLTVLMRVPNPRMVLLFYAVIQGLRVAFNAAGSAYASSNRMSCFLSRGLEIATEAAALIWLNAGRKTPGWLSAALLMNGAVFLVSNLHAVFRYHRCAGINYFDTVSENLLCLLCLLHMTEIQTAGVLLRALTLAAGIALVFSAGFTAAFNLRIGREERTEAAPVANGTPE